MSTEQNTQEELSRLAAQRLDKLNKLENIFNIDPYILNYENSKQDWQEFKTKRQKSIIIENYNNLEDGELIESETLWVAGRIHALRNNGMFIDLVDEHGKAQIVTDRDELVGEYTHGSDEDETHFMDLLDKGDIIAVAGHPYKTGRGHLSIKSRKIWILSKSIQSPPEIIEKKRRRLHPHHRRFSA